MGYNKEKKKTQVYIPRDLLENFFASSFASNIHKYIVKYMHKYIYACINISMLQ